MTMREINKTSSTKTHVHISLLELVAIVLIALAIVFVTSIGDLISIGVFGSSAQRPISVFTDSFGFAPFILVASIAASYERNRSFRRLSITLLLTISMTIGIEIWSGRLVSPTIAFSNCLQVLLVFGVCVLLMILYSRTKSISFSRERSVGSLVGFILGGITAGTLLGLNIWAEAMWGASVVILILKFAFTNRPHPEHSLRLLPVAVFLLPGIALGLCCSLLATFF